MIPGFLHTSPVHVATFDALLADALSGVDAVHVVDESLLADARHDGPGAVRGRVLDHLRDLRAAGVGIVCCTCSTIGAVAEDAAGDAGDLVVLRVDRPMAARAVRVEPRVGVVAALASTVEPTRELLDEEARRAGVPLVVEPVVVPGAWERFETGDSDGYLELVADAARDLAGRTDVVVLAQASMLAAPSRVTDVRVPPLAVERLAVAQ